MTKVINPNRFEIIKENLTQLFALILLGLIWILISATVAKGIFPSPFQVVPEMAELIRSGYFIVPLYSTFGRVTGGFLLALLLGLSIGILSSQNKSAETLSYLWLPVIMSTPALIMIFVGFMLLGMGNMSVILICGIVVLPTIAVNTRDCLKSVDRELLEMADSYRVSNAEKIKHIYIPHLLPALLAASRIGFSLSWKVAVLSEVFGLPNGIGYKIRIRYMQYDLKSLLAYLILFLLIVIIIEQILRVYERIATRWRG